MTWYHHTLWEQPYLDLWSTVHFSAGTLLGLIPIFIELSIVALILVVLAITVGWELVEVFYGIKEHFSNQIIDVVVAVFGLLTVSLLLTTLPKLRRRKKLLISILFGVFLLLNLIGWLAYQNYSGL
ncbi:MAG: hypothetical protein OQJ98_00135 [Candidatus Pacebacteria bacterium]|nr:hypothetical protein [Candidatus Paceibacterota bacterium]